MRAYVPVGSTLLNTVLSVMVTVSCTSCIRSFIFSHTKAEPLSMYLSVIYISYYYVIIKLLLCYFIMVVKVDISMLVILHASDIVYCRIR